MNSFTQRQLIKISWKIKKIDLCGNSVIGQRKILIAIEIEHEKRLTAEFIIVTWKYSWCQLRIAMWISIVETAWIEGISKYDEKKNFKQLAGN